MTFDEADLALLEVKLIELGPVAGRDVVQGLVDALKEAREEQARLEKAADDGVAKMLSVLEYVDDARRALQTLQGSDEPSRAVDRELDRIDDMLRDAERAGGE